MYDDNDLSVGLSNKWPLFFSLDIEPNDPESERAWSELHFDYRCQGVPKISKKKWPETLDINSQNKALIILFQIKGHLAQYLSLKKWPIYSLPHLSIR